MLTEAESARVAELARLHIATRSRDFAALRESGLVPLDLLSRGALEHSSSKVRRYCLMLIDHLGDERHIDVLATALRSDPVPRNRRHALHGLTCQQCKATELCVDVTSHVRACAEHDPNDRVREQARALLR